MWKQIFSKSGMSHISIRFVTEFWIKDLLNVLKYKSIFVANSY